MEFTIYGITYIVSVDDTSEYKTIVRVFDSSQVQVAAAYLWHKDSSSELMYFDQGAVFQHIYGPDSIYSDFDNSEEETLSLGRRLINNHPGI